MIPVVVLTGFLGAGKTTTLNALMAARPDLRVGVVENEAGPDGIDAELLTGAARVIDVVGGCACCTVRGALVSALELLTARAHELDLVVIEASGIADPVPIVQALQSPAARDAMRLSAIACVVDAAAVAAADLLPHVWTRQVRFAGHVVLTKTDLVAEHELAEVQRRIREHAPDAAIVDSLHEDATIGRLLTVPGTPPPEPAADDDDPGHGFTAHALRIDGDLDAAALDLWVSELLAQPGILRVKGTVAVAGLRRRYVVQGTPQRLDAYADPTAAAPRRSRLVVIGRDVDPDALQTGLHRCVTTATAVP